MEWVDKIWQREHTAFLAGMSAGVFFAIVLGVSMYIQTKDSVEEQMQQEAVEAGKAYWCIVDHQKVFSWEECE